MAIAYKIPGFFTTPASQLEALIRERERTQFNADKVASQYASVIKNLTDEIKALGGDPVANDVQEKEQK